MKTHPLLSIDSAGATTLLLVTETTLAKTLKLLSAEQREWVATHQFSGRPETSLLLPKAKGESPLALVGVKDPLSIWTIAHVPLQLPAGRYKIDAAIKPEMLEQLALGWVLAHYNFARYRKVDAKKCVLVLQSKALAEKVTEQAEAICLTRDLINTPTNDMLPDDLAKAAKQVAKRMGAECSVTRGDALLKQNYPAIHAVGRASDAPPCLIDMRWGNPKHPKVTLVGKGVCFDTGGLDLKPYSSMKLMKKDMGGAALVLGLAQLIAARKLPVRLRVLIPAVENAVSGNAFRPQDVIATRKGLTMEIGSTDAEGRVILADALHEADSESPDIIIDVATLTGAARTALGTEIPALFSLRPETGEALSKHSLHVHDPLWQLPLWEGYERYVKSPIADITNSPNYGYAGSITAALFLKKFVGKTKDWLHLDTMAWNIDPQPGRPVGGEALGLRALFTYLQKRYNNK